MHAMRYITRLHNGKGWKVKIDQGKQSEITKTFSDKHYGGEERALQAAKVFRDRRLIEKKKQKITSSRLRKQSSSNCSGYIGVSSETKEYLHSTYHGWRATYYINGRQQHKSFSSSVYGACEAFRKACRVRYECTGELRQVIDNPDVPCDPDVPVINCIEERGE